LVSEVGKICIFQDKLKIGAKYIWFYKDRHKINYHAKEDSRDLFLVFSIGIYCATLKLRRNNEKDTRYPGYDYMHNAHVMFWNRTTNILKS
jgi:hypothetical protein